MRRLASLALFGLIACQPTVQPPGDGDGPTTDCVVDDDCTAGVCMEGVCTTGGDGDLGDGDVGDGDVAGDGDGDNNGDGDGDATGDGDGDVLCQGEQPGPAPARLLTRTEYDRTIRDLLLLDDDLAHALFPLENQALGFENNAAAHQASPVAVQAFLDASEALAEAAVATRLGDIAPCAPGAIASQDSAETTICATVFVDSFGRRAFRRTLTPAERVIFLGLIEDGVTEFGLAEGIRWVIEAALQSPQFLYRIVEVGSAESEGQALTLSGVEIASRLSYLLWGSMPDDELLEAAESGGLDTPAGVEAQARRLLDDERAADAVVDFSRQWLGADRLLLTEKDAATSFGTTSEALGESLRESLFSFVTWAVFENEDSLAALFASNRVFVDDVLAPALGVATPTSMTGMDLPSTERAGLLTQPALMALLAHPDQSSPIQRGIFVREQILCEGLPDPPADLVIQPPDPDPNATTRERFAQHTEDPDCQACHILIDPVGFGFENYDEVGRFRTTENSLPIDASGSLLFTRDSDAIEGEFEGAVDLAGKLSTAPQVGECVAERWFTWTHGRGPSAGNDPCNLQQASEAFESSGHNVQELLIALAISDAVRLRESVNYDIPPPFVEPDLTDPEPDNTPEPDAEPDVIPGCETTGGGETPQGFLDSIDDSGVVRGWALDADSPCYALIVNVWMDGPPGQGTMLSPFVRADQPRGDVNTALGIAGDHGLLFVLPAPARDGQTHDIYLQAVDTNGDGNITVPNSPISFQAGAGDAVPVGVIDNVAANGLVNGWAYDPSNPDADLTLEVYLDAPSFLGGQLLGTTTTGLSRPDVNTAFGITGNQGYNYVLPGTAAGSHILYIEALDLSGNGNRGFLSTTGYAYEVTP